MLPDTGTDIGEILDHKRAAGWRRVDDVPTQHMVAVMAKTSLFAPHFAQVAPGRPGAFRLQGAAQTKITSLNFTPALLTQEMVVAGDGRRRYAQVHANDIGRSRDVRGGYIDDDVQPPTTIAVDQVGGYHLAADVLGGIGRNMKRKRHPTSSGGQTDGVRLPVNLERVDIVTRWTERCLGCRDLPTLASQGEHTLHGFRSLAPGLNVQIAHQVGVFGLEGAVRGMVQSDAILLAILPAISTDFIEGQREEAHRLSECLRLFFGCIEQHTDRPIRKQNIPYVRSIGK